MFGALKPGFRSLATLKLVVNVVGELYAEKNSYGIARFPCDGMAFLLSVTLLYQNDLTGSRYYVIDLGVNSWITYLF